MPLRCTRLLDPAAPGAVTHELCLGYDERVKSRLAAVCTDGTAITILLARGTVLRNGALLAADDGSVVRVTAAAQPVARVSADAPLTLMRAIYHLANRHVPAQLAADHALIEQDPVLERLLESLGARVERLQAPFDPEPGAYGAHAHGTVESDVTATVGEQLSIEAHRARLAALASNDTDRNR
jgi:urease accessory protein